MKVIFFGTPSFAAPSLAALIASRHPVVAVVTQPDRARGRGQQVTFSPVKALALDHQLPVLQPAKLDATAIGGIRATGAEIAVVAAYGKILPQALLDALPRGFINVHASLLPRWRGAAPIHRAILAGDAVTGVTIMRVVFALDAGAMISTVDVPIDDEVTTVALEQRLASAGADLLVRTLDDLERGVTHEVPQDEALVTYAKKIERADGLIDWSRSARDIHNQIRGLHPWPLASTTFREKRVILRGSRVSAEAGAGQTPGTIVEAAGDMLRVRAGTGELSITSLQFEGGRPMTPREFINGTRPRPDAGDRFGLATS
jgi:methionyl-tRNA formyltransferase